MKHIYKQGLCSQLRCNSQLFPSFPAQPRTWFHFPTPKKTMLLTLSYQHPRFTPCPLRGQPHLLMPLTLLLWPSTARGDHIPGEKDALTQRWLQAEGKPLILPAILPHQPSLPSFLIPNLTGPHASPPAALPASSLNNVLFSFGEHRGAPFLPFFSARGGSVRTPILCTQSQGKIYSPLSDKGQTLLSSTLGSSPWGSHITNQSSSLSSIFNPLMCPITY